MKSMFYLSGENIPLAKEEVLAVTNAKSFELKDRLLILDSKKDYSNLAFTRSVCQLLFSCSKSDLEKKIKSFNWSKYYKKDFCVRIKNRDRFSEAELASFIWYRLKKPKVNLTNPSTSFHFFYHGSKVYCGLLKKQFRHDFSKRKPHLRPGFHPTSLSPKLSRALVNLSGVRRGTILDPFVGTGGILIEAALLNHKAKGSDISKNMIKRTKENLKKFRLKASLKVEDALNLKKMRVDAIVTDPPYGLRSFISKKRSSLYNDFIKTAYSILKPNSRLVIVSPTTIKKQKFKSMKKIPVYVHKTLTRNVYVLKK